MDDDARNEGAAISLEHCIVCQERLSGNVFTWPGCRNTNGPVAHQMHSDCLAGMLSSLPGWPSERPGQAQASELIRESVRRGSPGRNDSVPPPPHLPCPACRQRWTDIDGIAVAAFAMAVWPTPAAPAGRRPAPSDGQPARPAVPSALCSLDLTEMRWSTYRRAMRDPAAPRNDPSAWRQGPWQGEFQCASERCAGIHGDHTAPSELADVPSLWRRVPAPRAALPPCQCQTQPMAPVLLHSPGGHWSAAWQCFHCGVQSRATAEQAVDVGLWMLAADRLGLDQWQTAAAADTSAGFWSAVRDCIAETVLDSASGRGFDYYNSGPPRQFVAQTNSRIFVPLLLDAAGLLTDVAQRAWRQHAAETNDWGNWVHELRSAHMSMTALVTRLQGKLVRQTQADPLNENVCLLWQCARHVGGIGSSTTLPEIVRASRNRSGYIPGLAQEVLLEAFGGQHLAQAVALFANALRMRRAEAGGGAVEVQPAAGAGGERTGRFVRGSDLVTGHGWNRTVAAASERCDVPIASGSNPQRAAEPAAAASSSNPADGGPGEHADDRARSAAAVAQEQRTSHFNIADDAEGATGLTQSVEHVGLGDDSVMRVDADSASRPAGARRVRRRRGDPDQAWEILRCRMCTGDGAFQAQDSRGLMQHLVRAHLGQQLTAEAIAQLRHLDKAACRICSSIRARTTPHCSHCGCATATRPLQLGDSIPDRRRPATAESGAQDSPGSRRSVDDTAEAAGTQLSEHEQEEGSSVREARMSEDMMRELSHLQRVPLDSALVCVASRMATAWTESLNGSMDGDEIWSCLARYRSRLLLGPVPDGKDRNEELKRRLRLWEQGNFDELAHMMLGQQAEARRRARGAHEAGDPDAEEERLGRRARLTTAKGAVSKAVKSLVGGVADASPEERSAWTAEYIPRCGDDRGPFASAQEADMARAGAWGAGDRREARREMRKARRSPEGLPGIPWARLPPYAAPGPTGDRQEQLDDILRSCGASHRRKLRRALDELTVRWAINDLPPTCRWLLNTQGSFLQKQREPTSKEFDDEEWIRAAEMGVAGSDPLDSDDELPLLVDAEIDNGDDDGDICMEHVPMDRVVAFGDEMDVDATQPSQPPADGSRGCAPAVVEQPSAGQSHRPKVRPIQMGEFLRKWVSRRLQALNSNDTGKVMTAMRQLGVGTAGGAEALAIFQQLIYELWKAGDLTRPLARVKVDETNCFGRLEWPAIRAATSQTLPRHHAVTCWKHSGASAVEQPGVAPAQKDRGAEQGDVDGPLECSLTLGTVAGKSKHDLHAAQRQGVLPWASEEADAQHAAAEEFDARIRRIAEWENSVPSQRRDEAGAIQTDPRHEIQAFGGVADFWYLDDGDILCDPMLVCPLLQRYDRTDAEVGGLRNRPKSEVIYMVDEATLALYADPWQLETVKTLAAVRTPDESGLTLGVTTGSAEAVEEQLQQKVSVVKAIHERIAVCSDVQTEHVLSRQSLGVSRVNHILRVHGHLLHERDSLKGFDEATRCAMDRLFAGLSDESHEQATLGASLGGLGWRRASDTALAANLGALVTAAPKIKNMAAAAVHAGLLAPGRVEAKLEDKTARAEAAFLASLDELERVKAEDFLSRAKAAAAAQWEQVLQGQGSVAGSAPRADATFSNPDEHAAAPHNTTDDGGRADPDSSARRLSAPLVQKELSKLRDCTRLRALEQLLASQENWPQLDRLKELRRPEVCHKWLWHLDSSRGAVLGEPDYVANVQRRLGARLIAGHPPCRICGAPLDPQLEHSETCATAEATRGHYACVRSLVEGLRLADPTVTTEPVGLTSTSERPADILTSAAVPGRSAALDVCVASPNSASARGDAAAAAFRRKLRRYRQAIRELSRAGIAFRPMIWTADARPHPAVVRTLRFAAGIAATRHDGDGAAASMLGRWRHEITVAILRRRAAMARAVLPGRSSRADWLLTGRTAAPPSINGRQPLIEVHECEDEPGAHDGQAQDARREPSGVATYDTETAPQ